MISKVVFHIGPHKTGTTSFQKYICDNEKFLREKGVVVYKPLFRAGCAANDIGISVLREGVIDDLYPGPWDASAGQFNYPIDKAQWQAAIRKRLADLFLNCDASTLLISSEHLSFIRTSREISLLRGLFPRYAQQSWQAIFVHRDETARWSSYSNQISRSQLAEQQLVSSERNSWALLESNTWITDFDGMLAVWASAALVDIVPYDGNVIPRIMQKIGITNIPDAQVFENRSAPASAAALKNIYRKRLSATWVGKAWRSLKANFGR